MTGKQLWSPPLVPLHSPNPCALGQQVIAYLFGLAIVVRTRLIVEQRLLFILAIVLVSYCSPAYCPELSEARTIVSIVSPILYCLARTVV